MCCWTTNPNLVKHKYDTGEEVRYNGEEGTVTEVFPSETEGDTEYTVVTEDGEEVRVKEKQLEPAKVEEEVECRL